jgi:hypothetical protein
MRFLITATFPIQKISQRNGNGLKTAHIRCYFHNNLNAEPICILTALLFIVQEDCLLIWGLGQKKLRWLWTAVLYSCAV